MDNNKIIYSQKLKGKNNTVLRTFLFVLLALLAMVLLFVANFLPYSGVITVAVIFLLAFLTNKLLSGFVFDITYQLHPNRLSFDRKYGKLSWECEVFPLDEAEFFEDKIVHRGKTYPFAPDDKLKELLFKEKI